MASHKVTSSNQLLERILKQRTIGAIFPLKVSPLEWVKPFPNLIPLDFKRDIHLNSFQSATLRGMMDVIVCPCKYCIDICQMKYQIPPVIIITIANGGYMYCIL